MSTEPIYCYECKKELHDHDTIYDIGEEKQICEDCRDRYYIHCDDCNDLVHNNDIVLVDYNNRFVCEDCLDRYYTRCDDCGSIVHNEDSVSTSSLTLCNDCYDDHYFTCPGCNEIYHIDEREYLNDNYYCPDCADNHRGCILSYSSKPTPIFFGGANAGYGLELEIDEGSCREEAARAIERAGRGHIYIKEDGSLSYRGMEIVTHPATLSYHVNNFPWSDICDAALSYGYRSHDTDTCGLHIHASRSLFGNTPLEQDLTIAKIILLIDRWYDTHILQFSRRDYRKIRDWASKPNADIRPEDDDFEAVHKSKKSADSRYKAVNLCNRNTVEFRFFRGTLKRDTIIASIQWTDTIIRYCRDTQLRDLFDANWDTIFGNTEHLELTNYLKQRNLYNPTLFTAREAN